MSKDKMSFVLHTFTFPHSCFTWYSCTKFKTGIALYFRSMLTSETLRSAHLTLSLLSFPVISLPFMRNGAWWFFSTLIFQGKLVLTKRWAIYCAGKCVWRGSKFLTGNPAALGILLAFVG